ncbi:unnamed protein product [Rhodiola kirilowii]
MNLESSIPVPSVKELSKQHLQTLPPRYVRDDILLENPSVAPLHLRVPVIDFSNLVNAEFHQSELTKLHLACKHWGIFQLINHGVAEESLERMKKSAREFFDLPLEEKKRWDQKPGSLEGYGQAFVLSEDQKLEWADMIFLKALPANDRKSALWPNNPIDFREELEVYAENVNKVAVSIMEYMAMGLGLSKAREFTKAFVDGHYYMRMSCYPPCPEPEKAIGIAKHCDISAITFLLECGDVPGLQVFKDGQWVFIQPIQNSLVINVGQIVEIMSNGTYKAAEHRAVVNKSQERISIVTFCYPNSNADIGPVDELTESENPALFKSVKFDEYLDTFYRRKTETPFLDCFKL